jgi:hypothetical protein
MGLDERQPEPIESFSDPDSLSHADLEKELLRLPCRGYVMRRSRCHGVMILELTDI